MSVNVNPYQAEQPVRLDSGKGPLSGVTVTAFILAMLLVISFTSVKILSAAIPSQEIVATIFGWLGLVSIVVVAATIVLGHVGLMSTRLARKRGRMLAISATTLGYFFLLLYFNRVVVAVIALVTLPGGNFVQNFFYWV